jgi:parallel beta-helix repeat protein
MNKFRFALNASFFVLLMLAASSMAHAQATRTWVSGVGDDANPCSRTAPCKTFAGAISKTATGGEIDALDPGGFGAITITKSITLDGGTGQGFAAILVSGGVSGVIVNAAGGTVNLRHLSINGMRNGTSPGGRGVNIIAAKAVNIENCSIFSFANEGIFANMTTGGDILIKDTIVTDAGTAGVRAKTTGSGAANILFVTVDNSRADQNVQEGFRFEDNVRGTVRNSSASDNGLNGFVNITTTNTGEMNLENCVASNNKQWGIFAGGAATTTTRISNCSVSNNSVFGVQINAGGQVLSSSNNKIQGNGATGTSNVNGSLGTAPQS